MRVALVLNFPPSDHRMVYFRGLARSLARRGHQVSLIVQQGNDSEEEISPESYRVIGLMGRTYSLLGQLWFTIDLVAFLLRSKFDVIHGRNPFSSIIGALMLRKLGLITAPIIYDVRGLWIEMAYLTSRIGGLSRRLLLLLDGLALRASTRIIAISDPLRETLVQRGIRFDKIDVVLGDGVDLEYFPTTPSHERGMPLRIGYVGSLSLHRGVESILRAFAITQANTEQKLRLELIGPAGDDLNQIQRLISALGQEGIVSIRGNLPHTDAIAEMSKLDIALSYDGSGWLPLNVAVHTKVFEYMAAGVPIVATKHPANEVVLRHRVNALLTDANPEDFASAILELISDSELSGRISRNAHATVFEHTIDNKAEEVERAYSVALQP